MKFLGKEKIPFVIVFTKSDKIPKKNIQENLRVYKEKMLIDWETLPEIFINSIKDNEGRTKILSYIEKYNKEFYSNLNLRSWSAQQKIHYNLLMQMRSSNYM